MREVSVVLEAAGRRPADLELVASPVGDRREWSRKDQLNAIRAFVALSRRKKARLAVLSSFASTQLTAARLAFPALAGGCRLLAFLHNNLADLTGSPARGLGALAELVRTQVNGGPWPGGSVVCVLGKRVLEEVRKSLPSRCVSLAAIRHPYLFEAPPTAEEIAERLREPVFALVGNTYKGRLGEVVSAAQAMRRRFPAARFILAGSLSTGDRDLDAWAAEVLGPSASAGMLPREEFESRVRAASFGIVHLDPKTYQTRASGAVLDTFSACLPSVLRSVPFVDSCCEDEGIPAIRYRDAESLERAMAGLLEAFPPPGYSEQVRAIAERRASFSPDSVSGELRTVLSDELGLPVDA